MRSYTLPGSAPWRMRTQLAFGLLLGAVVLSAGILNTKIALLLAIAAGSIALLAIIAKVVLGGAQSVLVFWTAVFPAGYYFVAFPRERSVITLDRIVVGLIIAAAVLAKPERMADVPKQLRTAGMLWLAFVAAAALSLMNVADKFYPARMLFDSFVLPVILGWAVLAFLDVRRALPALHTAACVAALFSGSVAVAELLLNEELLALPGVQFAYAGNLPRPDGPFTSNDSLALVGAISFFFLLFLRSAMGPDISRLRRLLHAAGLSAAMAMAMLPMFRSVALTFAAILLIDTVWFAKDAAHKAARIAVLVVGVLAIGAVSYLAPQAVADRSDPANLWARVAEYEQSFRVFSDHPVIGVGFENFVNEVADDPRYDTYYQGVGSVDTPHNNLLTVLTETGVLGLVPYVAAQVMLFLAFWRISRRSAVGRACAKYFLYIVLCYWATGLDLTSGYSTPVNLWFIFSLMVVFKYTLTESSHPTWSRASRQQRTLAYV